MKKLMSMFAMLVIVSVLCGAGCKDTDKPTPDAAKPSKKTEDKNWQPPEATTQPAAGGGHEGHDHGPGGHAH